VPAGAGTGLTGGMDPDRAELSSVSTSLDDLSARVERLAGSLQRRRQDALAADLYEVERALRMAERRLAQVLRRLG
jgi:outer membrane murein-binding lipoprotein Lpp